MLMMIDAQQRRRTPAAATAFEKGPLTLCLSKAT
jgi:hypothetical protein